jgi:hypothetical protein
MNKMDRDAPLLNAQTLPPGLKELYKRYQKLKFEDLELDSEILDFNRSHLSGDVEALEPLKFAYIESLFKRFVEKGDGKVFASQDSPIYSHNKLPGR